MRAALWGAGLAVVICAGLAACGSDSGEKTTGSVEEADYPGKLAAAVCGAMAGCCKTHGFPHYGPDCETRITASVQTTVSDRESAGAVYDPANAGKCIDAYVGLFGGCGNDNNADSDHRRVRRCSWGRFRKVARCTQSGELSRHRDDLAWTEVVRLSS